jgi:MFS family permease
MNQSSNSGFIAQIKDLDYRFWIVNTMEILERLAYYGVRSVIAIYMVLPRELGGPQFTHVEKGIIFAWWAGLYSLIPMFAGGYADRYGHKKVLAISIILKIIGYIMMAYFLDFWGFFIGCVFLGGGTGVFKPAVQGTLAITLKKESSSLGWGIFYQMVNVGGFLGPVLAGVLRLMSWEYVFYSCAIIVALNFLWLPFYKDPSKDIKMGEAFSNPWKVFWSSLVGIFKPRVFFFCIVFAGFWLMFNQVFDLLPNVIDDWVDSSQVIRFAGKAFEIPFVTYALSFVCAVLAGGVFSAISWITLRPDLRKSRDVSKHAYIVIFFMLLMLMYFPISLMGLNFAFVLVFAIAFTLIMMKSNLKIKHFILIVFGIGIITTFPYLVDVFQKNAASLIEMAAQGKQINPEWMINLNPALIVFCMAFVGYLTSFFRPLSSIILGIFIATVGSLVAGVATSGWFCIFGILVFSVGEMFSSPKKMEYLAELAPKGQEGLYMGYTNVPIAIGWISGSLFAGNMYEKTGDKVNLAREHLENVIGMAHDAVVAIPKSEVMNTLATKLNITVMDAQNLLYKTYSPQKIWYYIAAIGFVSMAAMIIYDRVIKHLNKKAN